MNIAELPEFLMNYKFLELLEFRISMKSYENTK